MRFLTADYLYPLNTDPIKEGVLQISSSGEVIDVLSHRKSAPKKALEIFNGILCPGFINAHCHLELSHLKGLIEQRKGLLDFIMKIQQKRNFHKNDILAAIENAEKEMLKNGIVGVGDICNTQDTLTQKLKGNLKYYNFIEVFGVKDSNVNQIMIKARGLRDKFRRHKLKATIAPHAPYSVPKKLMQEIIGNFDSQDKLVSIHMQETSYENELFKNKQGELFNWLKNMNASSETWEKRNKSIDIFNDVKLKNGLLVHNTFAQKKDIGSHYYCTCPKANLYIENTLPDYNIFNVDKLCVGTDSLASNNSLSVLEELKIIKENSTFDLNTLFKIACKNGAEALGFDDLGTFEKGKKPGVNLISEWTKISVIA